MSKPSGNIPALSAEAIADVQFILELFDRIEKDPTAIDRAREWARGLPPDQARYALSRLEIAIFIADHGTPKSEKPAAAAKPPRTYRKGTGRKVVQWASCPWQPTA
jgi:hypothetical protein